MNSRGWAYGMVVALLFGMLFAETAAAQGPGRLPRRCARSASPPQGTGDTATATFHVVADDCQLSLVSISKFADGNAVFDTATGTFAASDTRATLTVNLPCGVSSETDLVLGPPTLYPPDDLDLGATAFDVACSSGGGAGGGGAGRRRGRYGRHTPRGLARSRHNRVRVEATGNGSGIRSN